MTLLLDTSVVIGHLRGEEPCASALEAHLRANADLRLSAVSWAEVLAGERLNPEAESTTVQLLDSFGLEVVTAGIATTAGRLLRAWRRSHGLRLPDALIAATALRLDCPLLTLDRRHFACVPGLVVAEPAT